MLQENIRQMEVKLKGNSIFNIYAAVLTFSSVGLCTDRIGLNIFFNHTYKQHRWPSYTQKWEKESSTNNNTKCVCIKYNKLQTHSRQIAFSMLFLCTNES